MNPYFKLPLKHVGSKLRQMNFLMSHLPSDATCFYDLFCGLGTVGINYATAYGCKLILNDVDKRLGNLYTVLGDAKLCTDVCDELHYLFDGGTEAYYEATYGSFKRVYNSDIYEEYDTASKCVIEVFLNRCSYGGLWRVNQKGEYNVPFSRKSKKSFDVSAFDAYGKMYRRLNQKYYQGCYSDRLRGIPDGSVIYLDPPYDDTFQGYTADKFGLTTFAKRCEMLKRQGHRVYISQSNTERVKKLFDGWSVIDYDCKKAVGSNSTTIASELLIY